MKVLLMVAPASGALTLEASNDIAQNMGFFPPLGILYIGTYLKENTNHEVVIIDSEAEQLTLGDIKKRFSEINPDVIGITTFTNTLYNVYKTLEVAKEACPQAKTVIGGPHMALYPQETLDFPTVDYGVIGYGEYAFTDLIKVLDQKLLGEKLDDELKKVEGIAFYTSKGEFYKNNYALIKDQEQLPHPDRSFLKKELYFCILGHKRQMTTAMSSRGCPFKCTFCNTPDRVYRYRGAVHVVDEMEKLKNQGFEEIFFFDDLFNINKKRVNEICNEIKQRGLKVSWAFRGRVTGLDEDTAKNLSEAGCERIQFGIEKATDEGLKKVKKSARVKDIWNAIELTKKYGMMAVGNFILFTPGEDESDAEEIIQFSLKLPLDHAEFSVFIPYPDTAIYKEGIDSGFFDKDAWQKYAANPVQDFQIHWEEKVPVRKMYEICNKAHKRFYFRPRIIWQEFKRVRNFTEFFRKAKGALAVLGLNEDFVVNDSKKKTA